MQWLEHAIVRTAQRCNPLSCRSRLTCLDKAEFADALMQTPPQCAAVHPMRSLRDGRPLSALPKYHLPELHDREQAILSALKITSRLVLVALGVR